MFIRISTTSVRTSVDVLAKQSPQSGDGICSPVSYKADSRSCPNEKLSSLFDQLPQLLLGGPRQCHLYIQPFRYLRHLLTQVLANIIADNRFIYVFIKTNSALLFATCLDISSLRLV